MALSPVSATYAPLAVGRDQDAAEAAPQRYPLCHGPGGGVQGDQVAAAHRGDQRLLPVRGELQAVGTPRPGIDRGDDLLGTDIDDRDAGISRVGRPQLLAVRRDVEAFRSSPHRDDRLPPARSSAEAARRWAAATARAARRPATGRAIARRSAEAARRRTIRRRTTRAARGRTAEAARRRAVGGRAAGAAGGRATRPAGPTAGAASLLDDADGVRVDVRREELLPVLGDHDHVRPVLAQAEQPVDLVRLRVVASDRHAALGGEIRLAIGEPEAVRAAERGDVNAMDLLPRRDVDDGQGVASARTRAGVVGRDGELPVVGDDQLVRVLSRGGPARHLAARRVDDGHRVLALEQDQQRRRRRLLRRGVGDGQATSMSSPVVIFIVAPPGCRRGPGRPRRPRGPDLSYNAKGVVSETVHSAD